MSTSITTRAAQVLVEIDAATAEALAWENLAWEKSLRCLKTAIEGLLPACGYWVGCAEALTTLLDQWEPAK